MKILPILTIPHKRLRQVSRPVETFDNKLQSLIDDMFETMYDAPGIGLAAPQIGLSLCLAVIDIAGREEAEPDPLVVINPKIVKASTELVSQEEGCLSIPDIVDDVARPAWVQVDFLDRHAKPQSLECHGLLATCMQHEIDHLNGVLFIDYLSILKRNRIEGKFKKMAKQASWSR